MTRVWETAAELRQAAGLPAALASAAVLHGALSAPVPPRLGPAEIAVAVCLLAATGWQRPALVAGGLGSAGDPWDGWRCRAAALLLWLPALVGLAQGHGLTAVARDAIPLGFLLLPVAVPAGTAQRVSPGRLADAVAVAGVLLALRHLALADVLPAAGLARLALPAAPDHLLANDLAVTFAAAWLALRGFRTGPGWRGMLIPLVCWPGALCAAAGLAHNLHRAGLAALALAWIAGLATALATPGRRRAGLAGLAATGLAGVAGAPQLTALADLLWLKTQVLGLNGRIAEFQAAWAAAARDPWTALFGHGWGLHWRNPAAGGAAVAYTHNALSYVLLKTGLVGLAAAAMAVAIPALRGLYGLWHWDRGLALAMALALGIGSAIHADFKTLSFGLILTIARVSEPFGAFSGPLAPKA